jgi:hypothetical protein
VVLEYPLLSGKAQRILIPFATSYLCEALAYFSKPCSRYCPVYLSYDLSIITKKRLLTMEYELATSSDETLKQQGIMGIKYHLILESSLVKF